MTPGSVRGVGKVLAGIACKHQAGVTAEGCARRVRSPLSPEREQDRNGISELGQEGRAWPCSMKKGSVTTGCNGGREYKEQEGVMAAGPALV